MAFSPDDFSSVTSFDWRFQLPLLLRTKPKVEATQVRYAQRRVIPFVLNANMWFPTDWLAYKLRGNLLCVLVTNGA